MNYRDTNSIKFLDLMAFYCFLPAHRIPTRNENCIDHVMLRSERHVVTCLLDTLITDHALVVVSLDVKITSKNLCTTRFKFDYPSIIDELTHTDFTTVH